VQVIEAICVPSVTNGVVLSKGITDVPEIPATVTVFDRFGRIAGVPDT
jgi:hypothetical protein